MPTYDVHYLNGKIERNKTMGFICSIKPIDWEMVKMVIDDKTGEIVFERD